MEAVVLDLAQHYQAVVFKPENKKRSINSKQNDDRQLSSAFARRGASANGCHSNWQRCCTSVERIICITLMVAATSGYLKNKYSYLSLTYTLFVASGTFQLNKQ